MSNVVTICQSCGGSLESVIWLGYLPPVNDLRPIGKAPTETPFYPAELLRCQTCTLVQLGYQVDPEIIFPPSYPYRSRTTRILRENFKDLANKTVPLIDPEGLVVDIGSNDGTLLSNFKGFRVQGVEPTDAGKEAQQSGIPTLQTYFDAQAAEAIVRSRGKAALVTATNVFAHIPDVHELVENVKTLMADDGIFVSESHYWNDLVATLQYDTIYHEHLRHYTVKSLQYLLNQHGLAVFRVDRIPTHGGSIRVYAQNGSLKWDYPESDADLTGFDLRVRKSRADLHHLLGGIGGRVWGVGAPSRASTLLSYTHIHLDAVAEVSDSPKIGHYMPGTLIPVVDEKRLYEEQPEYALMLSWHIADELMPKIREKGYRGKFIIPLPTPRLV